MEKSRKTIYEVIDEKYFDELKVNFHKDFLTKCKFGIQCFSIHSTQNKE